MFFNQWGMTYGGKSGALPPSGIEPKNVESYVSFVYGLPRSHKQVFVRLKTLTYIRLFGGDAISQPSMYAHPGASLS